MDTATTEIYTLSLHDALPIWLSQSRAVAVRFYLARKGVTPARMAAKGYGASGYIAPNGTAAGRAQNRRSEEHTSELQSRGHLVCRLLLEKKKEKHKKNNKNER